MSLFEVAGILDTCAFVSAGDTTKRVVLSCAGVSAGQTRTVTLPNGNGPIVLEGSTGPLTNKTITDAGSDVTARSLWFGTGGGSVSVWGSAAPVAGHVLTATDSTNATWQAPVAVSGTSALARSLQYDNAGMLAGSTSVAIADDGCLVLNADYAAPTASDPLKIKLFGADKGSRVGWVGEDAFAYAVAQRAIYNCSPAWWYANGRGQTTAVTLRLGNTVTGTATARNLATTNMLTSALRVGYRSANTAGSSAGWRHGSQNYWRGNGPQRGGFFFSVRFGMSSSAVVATQRSFVGLYAGTGAFPNANPGSSGGTAFVGFGNDSNDANWEPMCTVGGGAAPTIVNSGVAISAVSLSTSLLEFGLYARPNDTVIYWFMRDIEAGVFANGAFTANIPAGNIFLSPIVQTNNGTTAAEVAIDLCSVYIETPF